MGITKVVLNLLIRIQQSIPAILPNEYIAWRSYNRRFSKVCDGCNSNKGVYKLTYQDWRIPSTVVYPFPVRLCTDCVCEADEEVGVMSDEANGETFSIDRK